VDQIGGLDEAVAAAAARAGLEEGTYGRRYLDPEQTLLQRLAVEIGGQAVRTAGRLGLADVLTTLRGGSGGMTRAVLSRLDRELQLLSRFNDPRGIYSHCDCVTE
jgi:protease-4